MMNIGRAENFGGGGKGGECLCVCEFALRTPRPRLGTVKGMEDGKMERNGEGEVGADREREREAQSLSKQTNKHTNTETRSKGGEERGGKRRGGKKKRNTRLLHLWFVSFGRGFSMYGRGGE